MIADYGSSEGHNSLSSLIAAIGALRERIGRKRAISVVHTDLPGNDFTALFKVLASDPGSYLRGDPAVFPCAVGRSFYEQILPSSSVTLGWSSWAVQWLSRVPALIPDQVQVAYSRDAAAQAAFSKQAAEDWRCFLTHRGAELRSGGRLVVLSMALMNTAISAIEPRRRYLWQSAGPVGGGLSQSGRSAEHGNPDVRSESSGFHGAIRGEPEFRWFLARRD